MRKLTGNHIEVLFHYYINPSPHPRETVPAIKTVIQNFVDDGILTVFPEGEAGYCITFKGNKFIKMILETPYPVQRWTNPTKEEE